MQKAKQAAVRTIAAHTMKARTIEAHPTEAARRRVKKQDLHPDTWTKPDGLDYCLDCWKTWMHGDPDRDLRAKTTGGLLANGDGYGSDLYEAQQANDAKIAAATDAMIDSLKRIHIWAIYKMCSMATPWNYPHADFVGVGEEARSELQRKLKGNVCTSILF